MMLERIWNLSGKPRSTVHSERLSWRFLDLDAPNSGCSQTSYPQRLSGRRLINTHIFVTRIRSNCNKLEYSKELQILVYSFIHRIPGESSRKLLENDEIDLLDLWATIWNSFQLNCFELSCFEQLAST